MQLKYEPEAKFSLMLVTFFSELFNFKLIIIEQPAVIVGERWTNIMLE